MSQLSIFLLENEKQMNSYIQAIFKVHVKKSSISNRNPKYIPKYFGED
ncbi:hypothetical protein [Globicatella sulfidifaciens]|uniref:Uncharacterized protein n=1 Tax=Globicatella sulfidifaciens TaxID=136093 RepID=A0A7X8C3I1_9LACT|nr:hypothetical protein [Globicatella sulfidifaciens]NLJ18317.1 hypothetical protein [Globicatella sulfidifaciens]